MFAIVKTGGKQYRVAKDDVIIVEKLPGEAGATITLDEVLMVGDGASQKIGSPRVQGAAVAATIVAQQKGEKVIVFKKRRRHNYRRKRGHRQEQTVLKVTDIRAAG